jgi:hypothetical protein
MHGLLKSLVIRLNLFQLFELIRKNLVNLFLYIDYDTGLPMKEAVRKKTTKDEKN